MFGPEGTITDREHNISKLGYDRWGHYMFPSIHSLRNGHMLVRVYVGGDSDSRYQKAHEYLNYISDDGGNSWRHFAAYDHDQERLVTEIGLKLSNNEEIRFRNRIITFDAAKTKPRHKNYYRLGDLPRDLQWIPLLSRKEGAQQWTEERAYWDPDSLLFGREKTVGEGTGTRTLIEATLPGPTAATKSYLRSDPWSSAMMIELPDKSLVVTPDADANLRPMSDLQPTGVFVPLPENYVWRSRDRGRTWKYAASVPAFIYGKFFQTRRAHLETRFPGGDWIALYRTGGMYCSGGGPLLVRRSKDEGLTWSDPKAIRPCSAGTINGLMLENGIAVRAYGRPGAFLMFCGDGKGELWGSDVVLIQPWRNSMEENSCCNPNLISTGPDRFIIVYSKFDVSDPWGQKRQAIITQEFIVSKR